MNSAHRKACIEKIEGVTLLPKNPNDDRPRTARAAQEALNSFDFGSQQAGIEALVSALTGYPMKRQTTAGLQKHQAVMVIGNVGGHNYSTGSIVIITNPNGVSGIRTDGVSGNNLALKDFRMATKEEISKISDAQLEAAFKDALFL